MKFFERRASASDERKERGRRIAARAGLPKTVDELPPGNHSYERIFSLRRIPGYKGVYNSIDIYGIMSGEKEVFEARCHETGIRPVFKGDYITLHTFPRRNIIGEEIIEVSSHQGVKTVVKKAFFDVLDYIDEAT
ncbi:MAG: hypothetical protein JXR85_09420 [Deltaproteobacteria bacterium]|nr:hypothetical protein [Deltaproteobacteria bacterium]